MNYDQFRQTIFTLNKNDPRRIEAIKRYPHYAEHARNKAMAKLAEIRARKVDKQSA